jgi:UDP-2,3-diacylglucosamine pyrophosphatase LpxH
MSERAFVISDLHIGAGKAEPALEDFDADALFASWVKSIAGSETTLILNGDIVDFAQIPPYDVPLDSRLLWTEDASLQKLAVAEEAHPEWFAALAEFLERGGRLHLNIGNHDLDMAWPRVQERLHARLAPPLPERLSFSLRSIVRYGVLVEHGHQFTPENCPVDPERFLHSVGGERYLERVWGTDFMLRFYNDIEREFPYADCVKPMLTVLYYGLKNRWIGGRHFWRVLVFLKRRGISWSGVASSVLDDEELSIQRALSAVDDDTWKSVVRDTLEADPQFGGELEAGLEELSGAERSALLHGDGVTLGEAAVEDQTAVLGLVREEREARAARERLEAPGITHVVFGHTHRVVDGGLNGALFNPGTWIPHLDLEDEALRNKIRASGLTKEMLGDPRLYVADRRAVLIEPDAINRSRVRLERIGCA